MSTVAPERGLTDAVAARLYVAVGRLTRSLRRGSPTGLSLGGVSALATLVNAGPLRTGDLAAREGVSPPTMTRIVSMLADQGHVVRETDATDGRVSLVRATAEGERMMREVRSSRSRALLDRIDRLPPADLAALLAALPALEALADDG